MDWEYKNQTRRCSKMNANRFFEESIVLENNRVKLVPFSI